MTQRIRKDTQHKVVQLFLRQEQGDRVAPRTDLCAETANASACYLRENEASPVMVSLVPSRTGAYIEGGFHQVDAERMPGIYQFGIPNQALASGAHRVLIFFRFPDTVPVCLEIELVDFDPTDGVGLQLDGFTRSLRHEHLTSVFRRVMPTSVETLYEAQDQQNPSRGPS